VRPRIVPLDALQRWLLAEDVSSVRLQVSSGCAVLDP
jgi:hypothetical protein